MTARIYMTHFYRCIYILFISSIIFPYTRSEKLFNSIPPVEYNDWTVLKDDDIFVGWTSSDNYYWCRSRCVLSYDIATISSALENYESYPELFERVTAAKEINSNVVHVVLDMPYPFANRDYVVAFEKQYGENYRSIKFSSLEDDTILSVPESVRLIHAAGEWYLRKVDNNLTEITYTWNGELRGNFPSYGLTRAWNTQGAEVMNWIDEYLKLKE